MAVSAKLSLRKALAQSDLIDPLGLSPFVALHLAEPDRIHVRRTGAVGFVETLEAPSLDDPGWVFVSFAHLQDCLRVIETDEIEILTLAHGGTLLRSASSDYQTELQVHTVDRSRSGFKRHTAGDIFQVLEPNWLGGLNVRPFTLAQAPTVIRETLILPTHSGTIAWTNTYAPGLPSHPRESFLKAVSSLDKCVMELTVNGFYRAQLDEVNLFIASHQAVIAPGPLQGPVEDGDVELPAGRFILALDKAAGHAAPGASIKVSPRVGVSTKDIYSNPSTWSLGDTDPFPAITFSPKTARLLVDALGQAEGEKLTLVRIAGYRDLFRVTRGGCSVSFRVILTS